MLKNKLLLSKPYLFILPIVLIIGGILVVPTCYNYYISSDGEYGPWSPWSRCLKYCGDSYKERKRECTKKKIEYGKPCYVIGPSSEKSKCNLRPCPIDGGVGQWSAWDETCDRQCKTGRIARRRSCDKPTPKHWGLPCEEDMLDYKPCPNPVECPVDGVWGEWGEYSVCTQTCGGGNSSRGRTCTPPRFGGRECVGDPVESKRCNRRKCPGPVHARYKAWGPFSKCTVTCGGGTMTRTRVCIPPGPGGRSCKEVGGATDTRACNKKKC